MNTTADAGRAVADRILSRLQTILSWRLLRRRNCRPASRLGPRHLGLEAPVNGGRSDGSNDTELVSNQCNAVIGCCITGTAPVVPRRVWRVQHVRWVFTVDQL